MTSLSNHLKRMAIPLVLVCLSVFFYPGQIWGNQLLQPLPKVVSGNSGYTPVHAAFLKSAKYEEISKAGIFKSISVSDEVMYILNGRTLVSLDFLERKVGVRCTVKGTGGGGAYGIYAEKGFRKERVWAGERKDLPVFEIDGKAFVPLRLITDPFRMGLYFYPNRTIPMVVIDTEGALSREQYGELVKNEPAGIVDTPVDYGYDRMMGDIVALQAKYPFLQREVVGKSVQGRDLTVIKLGSGPKEVFYSAAIHPQEWITAPLLMKFIEEFSRAYASGEDFLGYSPRSIFSQTTIYLMPMCNPDGVELVQRGIARNDVYYEEIMQMNNWSADFSRWRANMNGVNLNLQFPALWELARETQDQFPSYSQYPGEAPLTEPESQAMHRFTLAHDFSLILAYHSQGEIIYWQYYGMEPPRSKDIVNQMAIISGYEPYEPPITRAGYRDWFVQQYGRPGFTIEVGKGANPLPLSQFEDIWNKNAPLMLYAAAL